MKRRRKKSERTKLRDRCDKLFRQIILERDGDTCQRCGRYVEGRNAHVAHIIPRSRTNYWLRWTPDNALLMCYACHINWWHKHPLESGEWFRRKYRKRLERITELNTLRPMAAWEMEEIYKNMKRELGDGK